MGDIQNYKCPCCGDSLIFSSASKGLHCESCGNDFSIDTMQQIDAAEQEVNSASKFDWEHYTPRSYENDDEINLAGYSCPSCGAEITGDDSLGAAVCPYCGNAVIIKGQFEGDLRPDYLIPFKFDKKAAVKAFEADFLKAPFLPDEFKNKKKIEEMSGIYIPFWMFDCDCNANIIYKAQRVHIWSDSNYNYTKTDHFKLLRGGSVGFANIPVDASEKADDTYMEAVEPFDYSDAVNFNSAYLSGYLADKYDVSTEECVPRANERVENSTKSVFADTTAGYTGVVPEAANISFSGGKIRYALLPVWMLNIKYMNKMYKFAINGQTGKVAGEYPVDKKKRNRYFAKVAGIAYIVAAAAVWFLLKG